MRIIELNGEHRKKHFEFFTSQNHPHFNLCANVDISNLLAVVKTRQLPFMITVTWLVSKVANEIPELRQRLREKTIVEHDAVHPSFTVPTKTSDVFSFCEVDYEDDFDSFLKRAQQKVAELQLHPSFEDEIGRDDYLFLSSMPWVSFTSVQHAMHYHPHDSVPRIVWGKYFHEAEKIKMPLSLQAHHALVDGKHAGQFFNNFEEIANKPERWAML